LPLLPSACLSALLQLLSLALRIACFMVFVLCILSDMVFLLFFSKQIFNRVLHAPLYRSDKGYQRSRQLLSTGAVLIMWETFILTLSHSKTRPALRYGPEEALLYASAQRQLMQSTCA
jgi:hypothetical protein